MYPDESYIDHENPTSIFRYRPISMNSLYEVATASFYLAKPSDFNDPFDCSFDWKEHSDEEKREHMEYIIERESPRPDSESSGTLEEVKSSLEYYTSDEIANLGITCFTSNPFSPLMWSHYADGHKGICIEYSRDGILATNQFRAVQYNREGKLVWDFLKIAKNFEEGIMDFFNNVVYRKLQDWSYEKEWRVMALRPEERMCHIPSPVVSITFGLKCGEREMVKVLNILNMKNNINNLEVYRITLSETGRLVAQKVKLISSHSE